ncbi:MAG TPA: DUF2953 domain-containing protein [Bacillota bacterium]|nr:DUF2953 domain-containing protein [Bacillota bacterium]
MVELFLFLGTISLFFFLPVDFRIFYKKTGAEDSIILEMTFLKGLLTRRKVINSLSGPDREEKTFGRWFWLKERQIKRKSKPKISSAQARVAKPQSEPETGAPELPKGAEPPKGALEKSLEDVQEFLERYRNFGLGITLLTYFLPAQYHHWLLVTPELEREGYFERFHWSTQFGTGNPASTALGYGALWSLKAGIGGYLNEKIKFKNPPRLVVVPDFIVAKWDTVFDCIFRIKLGYIIIAALLARFRLRIMKGGVGIE